MKDLRSLLSLARDAPNDPLKVLEPLLSRTIFRRGRQNKVKTIHSIQNPLFLGPTDLADLQNYSLNYKILTENFPGSNHSENLLFFQRKHYVYYIAMSNNSAFSTGVVLWKKTVLHGFWLVQVGFLYGLVVGCGSYMVHTKYTKR